MSKNKSVGDEIIQSRDELLYEAVFQAHPLAQFVTLPDGSILHCNKAAVETTGYSADDLAQVSIARIVHEEIVTYIASASKGNGIGKGFTLDSDCVRRNGDRFPARVIVTPLKMTGDLRLLIVIEDISEQRKAETDRESLKDHLRHAVKMETVGNLAGGIAHYFNNVFTGIMGTLTLAREDASEKLLPLVNNAMKSAGRASGFTRQLLSFSRDEKLVMAPTDTGALIEEIESFARLTLDSSIDVKITLKDLPDTVLADAASIHHVLLNLVINARDALLEKQSAVSWETDMQIIIDAANITVGNPDDFTSPDARKGRFVRISVTDNGAGMSDETRKRVFEAYFTTKESVTGTGLGLSTASDTIRTHGGWIELSSKEGSGTTVAVYLPVTSLKKTLLRIEEPDELPGGSEKILVVDDDELIRSFGVIMLERLGYTVIPANNGRTCLDMFMRERDSIDLVILDLMLPVISGKEVLRKIRRIDKNVKVLILSGHGFENDQGAFADLRADDYIVKPFTVPEMAMAVRNVLDGRKIAE